MSNGLPLYPFDPHRGIGTVCEIGPNYAKVDLPNTAKPEGQWLHGNRLDAGQVGEFVVIECGELAVFGRLITVKLPEKERLNVEPELGSTREAYPSAPSNSSQQYRCAMAVLRGAYHNTHGSAAASFSGHPQLIKWLAEASGRRSGGPTPLLLNMATLPTSTETGVSFTPENLFGRHCAVLGATGGGKSWTVARIIEQAALLDAKVILLDATGEFHRLAAGVAHLHIGADPQKEPAESEEVVVPSFQLMEADLLSLFKPSGQSQSPKFRAAMKTLKLVKVAPALAIANGVFAKAGKRKADFEREMKAHAAVVEGARADFDIAKLTRQIDEECVWPAGGIGASPDPTSWGRMDEQARSYCVSLITRIDDILGSNELACVFKPQGKPSVFDRIETLLSDEENKVLRISLKYVPFAHDAREIVANAIGRYLLTLARQGRFREKPVLMFLDGASVPQQNIGR